jgi:hypothetical protein
MQARAYPDYQSEDTVGTEFKPATDYYESDGSQMYTR